MSKVGGLRALIDTLVGQSPSRLNADALLMKQRGLAKARDYTPIETWDEFLNERNMVPKDINLSDYADLVRAKELSDKGYAFRTQRGPGLNIGNSTTPGWIGTHFDLAGGPQALDILSSAKRTPAQLEDPTLVESVIDPKAKVLVVNDEIVNDPGHVYWAKLLGRDRIFTDERPLQDALRSSGIQGLIYNNIYEGHKNRSWPTELYIENKPVSLGAAAWQFGNPGISVLDPNILDIRHVGKKQGGLVQMCSCRQ